MNGHMGTEWLTVSGLFVSWLAGTPSSPESIVCHAASLGKDQKLRFDVCFLLNAYCLPTAVKLKTLKSNHMEGRIIFI